MKNDATYDLWKESEPNEKSDNEQQEVKKDKKKLHKGALIPSNKHLNWRDEIDNIIKK